MMDLDRALADISVIRGQIARAATFYGYGPATVAATGGLAVLAAVIQGHWLSDPGRNTNAYLGLWVATAVLSALLMGTDMVTRARRVHSGLAEEMIWAAVEQMLPALAAGVLVTAVLVRFVPESLWMLPGLWQILFSLGLFPSGRFLPRGIFCVGVWYLATGLACLVFAAGPYAFSPWAMGIPFGIGQLAAAAVLHWRVGDGDEPA